MNGATVRIKHIVRKRSRMIHPASLVMRRLRRGWSLVLFVLPDSFDLRPELADGIGQNTEANLRHHAAAADGEQVAVRSPRALDDSRAEGREVERNLQTSFGLCPVIGNKI